MRHPAENFREACEHGYKIYDFGVGDEPYKRLWCDLETTQFDVLVPLTIGGRLLRGGMRVANWLKSSVKNRPAIWRLAKALRKRGSSIRTREDESAASVRMR